MLTSFKVVSKDDTKQLITIEYNFDSGLPQKIEKHYLPNNYPSNDEEVFAFATEYGIAYEKGKLLEITPSDVTVGTVVII